MPSESEDHDPIHLASRTLGVGERNFEYLVSGVERHDSAITISSPSPKLEDHADDPVVEELTSLIDSLSEDEQVDLVTLAWLGREDYSVDDWTELRQEAMRAHNENTASYLLGMPMLGDFLEEGLSMLGRSCEEFEIERL